MKIPTIIPVVIAALLLSACSSMRTIRVSVVDSTTKLPVREATVATGYSPAAYSLASCKQIILVTDNEGKAELRANYLTRQPTLYGYANDPLAPFICVESKDYLYTEHWPALNDSSGDILIELTPRGDQTRYPDDLWIQPSFFRRLAWNFRQSWQRLTSRPEICSVGKNEN